MTREIIEEECYMLHIKMKAEQPAAYQDPNLSFLSTEHIK